MADYGALGSAISDASGQGATLSGELGYEIDGVFCVLDPNDVRRFIVRFPNGNWVSALHRGKVQQKPGLPVLVGFDNIGRPYIIGVDPTKIDNFLDSGNSGVAVGLHDHVRSSALQYIIDTWLLKQLAVRVQSGFVLEVTAGMYFWNNTLQWYDGGTLNVSASQPAETAAYRWIVVGIQPATQTLVYAQSASSFSAYPYSQQEIEAVAQTLIQQGVILLAAVWVKGGVATLYNYQIEDLRFASGAQITHLGDLIDVITGIPESGDVLAYDGYHWRPQAGGGSGTITVTDTVTTVDPAGTLSFDPAFFDVTNPSGSVAAVTLLTSSQGGLFVNEDLTAMIDGVETIFVLSNQFVTESTAIYRNGVRLHLNVDYTETGVDDEVTLVDAPLIGDSLSADGVIA